MKQLLNSFLFPLQTRTLSLNLTFRKVKRKVMSDVTTDMYLELKKKLDWAKHQVFAVISDTEFYATAWLQIFLVKRETTVKPGAKPPT